MFPGYFIKTKRMYTDQRIYICTILTTFMPDPLLMSCPPCQLP